MIQQPVIVKLATYEADELVDVQLIECGIELANELRRFWDQGNCEPALQTQLRDLLPEALPYVTLPIEDLDKRLRGYLCGAFLERKGLPIVPVDAFFCQKI